MKPYGSKDKTHCLSRKWEKALKKRAKAEGRRSGKRAARALASEPK